MSTTPNMNLLLPIPTITPGPTYASENNDAFDLVDSHDHTLGKGVPVPSNGIDINNDLPFNGFNASSLRSTQFNNQLSPLSLPTDINSLYVVNGNLWYNNQIGQQVQLTSGASLNASSIGGIGGDYVGSGALEFYTSASKTFTFWSSNNTPANLDAGSVTIRNILTGSNGITLGPNGTIPSNYGIQLPPSNTGTTSFLTYDTSNNILIGPSTVAGITGANIAPQTITQDLLAPRPSNNPAGIGQIAVSAPFNFSTTSTTTVGITGASVTLTTTGRPVVIFLQTEYNLPGVATGYISMLNGTNTNFTASIFVVNTTTSVGVQQFEIGNIMTAVPSGQLFTSPSVIYALDTGVSGLPGTYTYSLEGLSGIANCVFSFVNCVLVAYEI